MVLIYTIAFLAVNHLYPGPVGDEEHFVLTIKQFGKSIDLETLKHYDEMSTPAPFVVYGLWGRMVGFELIPLRLLSVLIAVVTAYLLHRLFADLLQNQRKATALALLVVLHPYMLAFGVLVHTDMPAIGCLVLAMLALHRKQPAILALALAGALLCRQYMAFGVLATGIYIQLQWVLDRSKFAPAMLIAIVISVLPLATLVAFWGQLSPLSPRAENYLGEELRFRPVSAVLYVSLCSIYLLPVLSLRWRACLGRWQVWFVAAMFSWLYWLYPVQASRIAVREGFHTVGLFHKFLQWTLEQGGADAWLEHWVFFAGYVTGLAIVATIVFDLYKSVQRRAFGMTAFMDLAVLCFLIMMPWSYLHWEKYFMPLFPVVLLRVLMLPTPSTAAHVQEKTKEKGY